MEDQPFWKAKTAFLCYLALAAGLVVESIIAAIILLGLGIDIQEPSFPVALLTIPITEGTILGITLLFAKSEGASLRKLGLKKPSLKMIAIASCAAVFILFLAGYISLAEETVFGPDPDAESVTEVLLPRNSLQLIALIGLSLAVVGPAEELAFRGFVQRGLENSFGKGTGLVVASVLFGLLHGFNSLWAILPVTVVGLFLGYIWQKTDGNTVASAWMHGLYDAITIAIAFFAYA
jgi:membrane protease YdiL (CAAX protease family)